MTGRVFACDQFAVNEAWIIAKVNAAPIAVKEGPQDVYVVMDAGSGYVIGRPLIVKSGEVPAVSEVDSIFRLGLEMARRWPKKILIETTLPDGNSCEQVARGKGISMERVTTAELAAIIQPLRDSFTRYITSHTNTC